MNILVISTVPYGANGIANVIKNIYCNKFFKNDKIIFVFPKNDKNETYLELIQNNNKVIIVKRAKNQIGTYIRSIYRIIKDYSIGIVHVHGNSHTIFLELLAAKLAGCKIRIAHSHNTTCLHRFAHLMLTPLFNCVYTDAFACGIEAGKWMFGKNRFRVINNAINTQLFIFDQENRSLIRKKYMIEDKYVIGNVGSLNYQKHQDYLIRVLHKINTISPSKYVLMLVGSGELEKEYKSLAAELDVSDSILFIGSTLSVEKFLSAMDIYVMSSRYEGLPLSLIESQANGLTCLIPDTISNEVDKSGNVINLPNCTQDNIMTWVSRIMSISTSDNDRVRKSVEAINKIKKVGYDSVSLANRIHLYFQKREKTEYNGR